MPLVFSSMPPLLAPPQFLCFACGSIHFNCKTMPVASFAPQSPRFPCSVPLSFAKASRFSAVAELICPTLTRSFIALPMLITMIHCLCSVMPISTIAKHLGSPPGHSFGSPRGSALFTSLTILCTSIAACIRSFPCHSAPCLSFAKQTLRITSEARQFYATALLRYSIAIASLLPALP